MSQSLMQLNMAVTLYESKQWIVTMNQWNHLHNLELRWTNVRPHSCKQLKIIKSHSPNSMYLYVHLVLRRFALIQYDIHIIPEWWSIPCLSKGRFVVVFGDHGRLWSSIRTICSCTWLGCGSCYLYLVDVLVQWWL